MYSLSKLVKDGYDISIATLTNKDREFKLQRNGYNIYFFPVDGRKKKFGEQTSIKLLRFLEERRPDIIHLQGLHNVMNVIIHEKLRDPKYVLRSHGKSIDDLLIEKVDILEVSNDEQKQEALRTFSVEKERIFVIPYGADVDLFKPQEDVEKEYDVVFVGRLSKEKNIELLISVFRNIDGTLLLIGDGPCRETYEKLIATLEKKVTIMGWTKNRYLPEYLNKCKIFVNPSPSEGSGRAVAEAMACGLPVIVMKNSRGSEAYVEHNRSGLILKPIGLGAAIKRLVANEELCKKLGSRGRELAAHKYSNEKMYKGLKTLYETCLSLPPNANKRYQASNRRHRAFLGPLFRVGSIVSTRGIGKRLSDKVLTTVKHNPKLQQIPRIKKLYLLYDEFIKSRFVKEYIEQT